MKNYACNHVREMLHKLLKYRHCHIQCHLVFCKNTYCLQCVVKTANSVLTVV